MRRYVRELSTPRAILWCYLIWYVSVLLRYFDGSARLWLSSLGLGAIVGTALYLSTVHAGKSKTVLARWQVFRLFLMPFCVSSFAALIKGRGFLLVFYPGLHDNLVAALACAVFLLGVGWVKRAAPPRAVSPVASIGARTPS